MWYERAELITTYNQIRVSQDPSHTPYRTAIELNISKAAIYEAITLTKFMNDEYRKMDRNSALDTIRKRKLNGSTEEI